MLNKKKTKKTVEANVQKQKEREERNIDDLWYENENLQEKLRVLEDKSRRNNILVDGLEELDKFFGANRKHIARDA